MEQTNSARLDEPDEDSTISNILIIHNNIKYDVTYKSGNAYAFL